jgi:serine/threonine-protein kinase RsbW
MSVLLTASRRVSLTIPRDTDFLSLVRRAVVDLACENGFDDAALAEIEMAVDEAASNAIRHAQGGEESISLEAAIDPRGITVTVCDGGEPFALERAPCASDLDTWREEPSGGGLGVLIIRRFMDEVECRHRPETGNELRMRRYLAARERAASGEVVLEAVATTAITASGG